uniref:transposase n=1 Tax=Sphingomonas bacterium TaxID=1895847 RepID=UPI0026274D78|nr:transposase [Sphingomonas bacterium]
MKSGPHTCYKSAFIEEARRAYEAGASHKDVARRLNIDVSTLYRWRSSFPISPPPSRSARRKADHRRTFPTLLRKIRHAVTRQVA